MLLCKGGGRPGWVGWGGVGGEKKVASVHVKDTPWMEQKFTTERITERQSDRGRETLRQRCR